MRDKAFIFPDWEAIAAEVDINDDESYLQDVYVQLGRLWVAGLRQQFGPNYHLVESSNFFLLSQAMKRRRQRRSASSNNVSGAFKLACLLFRNVPVMASGRCCVSTVICSTVI